MNESSKGLMNIAVNFILEVTWSSINTDVKVVVFISNFKQVENKCNADLAVAAGKKLLHFFKDIKRNKTFI